MKPRKSKAREWWLHVASPTDEVVAGYTNPRDAEARVHPYIGDTIVHVREVQRKGNSK